ncbi:MAG TPA: AAA family ATPase, partial [Candidatus Saccharimonadales bacterium]|nr:AAA family ATPase [Candidatus Saccharimonadales bacterium]
MPLLATKTFVPRRRSRTVPRPRLRDRLDEASGRRLTLVSAPAGFGKTSLVADWVATCGKPVAWLSLDEADADPSRFLAYLVASLRTVVPGAGEALLPLLASPQPPPIESTVTALVNDLADAPGEFVLVLDDLHVVDSRVVDAALAFLVEHLPPQLHLVLVTREDPALPLARLRACGDVLELRAADLRFTADESTAFLTDVMKLALDQPEIDALEATTEGWIVGLQLAAISLRGHPDPGTFIRSFSGSHRFVLDYLLEEVLERQPAAVTRFLLGTSILDRLSGPLCDAVTLDPETPGQQTIEQLERANLFVVALDGDRRWYRYH